MNGPTRLACCLCGLLLLAASCGKKEDKPRDESFIEAGAPVKISDLTLPGIVRDSEGALIVTAFIHSTFPSATEARDAIAVFRSEDKGATWEQVSTVPSFVTYGVWGYDLAIDESDSLYITWVAALYEPDSPQPFKAIMFSRSDDGGFSWTEPVRASDATTGQRRNPVIAAGGGNVYIAWLDGPDGRKTATEDVFFASSTDWGDSWSADTCLEIDLGAKDSASGEPSLCVAADGTVYCAYFSMRKAGNRGKPMAGFFLATSQDRGRSFSTSSHEAGVLRGLALVQKKNKLYLAAVHIKGIKSISTAETSQEIHLYVSDDGGEEWGKPVRIDDDPARERKGNLKLAVERQGGGAEPRGHHAAGRGGQRVQGLFLPRRRRRPEGAGGRNVPGHGPGLPLRPGGSRRLTGQPLRVTRLPNPASTLLPQEGASVPTRTLHEPYINPARARHHAYTSTTQTLHGRYLNATREARLGRRNAG